MNIFVLDKDPMVAARMHMDAHIARQLMACAQLLSAAHVYLDGVALARVRIPHLIETIRDGERDHRWAQWVRVSDINYRWVLDHMYALGMEYNERFGLPSPHGTLAYELALQPFGIPMCERHSEWPQTMPPQYRNSDPVEAYRNYYVFMKHDIRMSTTIKWSPPATIPTWWIELGGAK